MSLFVGAIVSTAISTLGALLFRPKKQSTGNTFEPTPYTRRVVSGNTPVVFGRRKAYGIEVYRKNDSASDGASSQQFFAIIYSVGPIGFIADTQVYNERNIWSLGFKDIHSSVIAYFYGKSDQAATGFGWKNLDAVLRTAIKNNYDAYGVVVTPDTAHDLAYRYRAGINLFLAADEQGRNAGMEIAASSIVYGRLCKRFKNDDGDYVAVIGDHNKYCEFWDVDAEKHYTGQVATGTYTASELAAAVEIALEAAVDDDGFATSIASTVSYSAVTDKFTISVDAEIKLLTWNGAYRGVDVYDELGLLRGQRTAFDPLAEGGNEFDDLLLTGTWPYYTVTSYHTFSETFTQNPIRICFEARTNPHLSPGIERPDDFDYDLMIDEAAYCDEIVVVDSVTQYDIQPWNIIPQLFGRRPGNRAKGSDVDAFGTIDEIVSGTSVDSDGALRLVDGSYTNATTGADAEDSTLIQQIGINLNGKKTISSIVLKTDNTAAQSFTVQYAVTAPTVIKQKKGSIIYWSDANWNDFSGGQGVISAHTGDLTITLSSAMTITGIRLISFSSAVGNFSLTEVEVYRSSPYTTQNIANGTNVIVINSTVTTIPQRFNGKQALTDGNTDTSVEFDSFPGGAGTAGPYYEIRFPFKRRIGHIVLATNVGEEQQYNIYYQAATGGAWALLATRTNVRGTDYVFFDPTEMISFRVTDMVRGDGTNPFSITEIEAYDAIPSRRYTADAVIETGNKFKDTMRSIYESFFAIPCEQDGKKWIRVERDESPKQEINSNHIVSCVKKRAPRRDRVNQWIIRYANELKDYQADSHIVNDFSGQLRTQHYPGGGTGNVIQSKEIELVAATRPQQVARMGAVIRERARVADNIYTIETIPGSIFARLGDVIRIDLPEFRINNQLARIMRISLREDLSCEIECWKHVAEVYADVAVDLDEDTGITRTVDRDGEGEEIIPADAEEVTIIVDEPEEVGITTPRLKGFAGVPKDNSISRIDWWVNINEAVDDDGNRIYSREQSTVSGDREEIVTIDTSGSDDDIYKVRVVAQTVSRSGMRKSIESIVNDWSEGRNSAVAELQIPFDSESNYYAALAAQQSRTAAQGMTYSYFEGQNNGIADIILPKFIPGHTRLYVFGKQGRWIPRFANSSLWMFDEVQDGGGDYTIVRPRYTMGAGPYFIEYIKDV